MGKNASKGVIREEEQTIGEFLGRIFKRDFSGSTGTEIKNSMIKFSSSIIEKVGALIFTIILARILLPELFGVYSLVLAIIVIFSSISDLGIGDSITRFASKKLGENNAKKAGEYTRYFLKIKTFLLICSTILLLLFAGYFAEKLFGMAISLALLTGAVYILFSSFASILESFLASINNFKWILIRGAIFQILRIILVPIAVILATKNIIEGGGIVAIVILGLAASAALSVFIVYFFVQKKFTFIRSIRKQKTSEVEKNKAKKFFYSMPGIVLSGLFFGEIDILLLGYFVIPEFVGYYRAALGLAMGVIGILTFSSALLPVFSRMKKKKIDADFKKFFYITFSLAVCAIIFILALAPIVVQIVYGKDYLAAANILRLLSLVIILNPLISLYEVYFVSQGKPKIVTKVLVFSTVLNIILTIAAISLLIGYNQLYALYGAIAASIVSRVVAFSLLSAKKKKFE